MKVLGIVGSIFLVIGLGMLGGAYYLYQSTSEFIENASTTQGVVADIAWRSSDDGSVCYPQISYQHPTEGTVRFEGSVGSNPCSFDRGEKVDVYYDPANPHEAKINAFWSLWFLPILLGGMGVIFGGIGGGMTGWILHRKKQIAWLKSSGQRISAKVSGVELDTSTRVNNKSPYRVFAQWRNPMSGEEITFKSGHIWYDPKGYLPSEHIDVLIDPHNPKKYWMDISILPKKP